MLAALDAGDHGKLGANADFLGQVTGLTFLINHSTLDALLYRKRWKIELLFKWMKQHPHVKAFFGTTPNAVKTQLWIAVA